MIIQSAIKTYEVKFLQDYYFVNTICNENTMVVIDDRVYQLYKGTAFSCVNTEKLILVNAIEKNKTIETALEICEKITTLSAKRNAQLIAIGGGIIQDIVGFAANIIYRGISWSFIPTTLLSACDSCIGGKTSLNYKNYKNLLGTFYPPDYIYICSNFFDTLSNEDFESGLGEMVKFNIMQGREGLQNIERCLDGLKDRDKELLDCFIEKSLQFKKRFIEEDEFDRGVRVKLNYAHTFGHAFETMSAYKIPHGTAVAMGTIVANRISTCRGILQDKTTMGIESLLLKIIHIDSVNFQIDMQKIIDAIRKDKKQTNKSITAILLDNNFCLQIVNDIEENEIEYAVQYLFEKLK